MSKPTKHSGANIRANVARGLENVADKRRTTDWLRRKHPDWVQEPLAQELLQGTLRHFFSLSSEVTATLTRPLKPKDQTLYYLMLVGAYQLRYLNIPDHAVINETVDATRVLGRPWAKGLVNAVLRNTQRKIKGAGELKNDTSERSFEHPQWLIDLLFSQYPDAAALMQANNQRAPMALRINQSRCTPGDYLRELDEQGIAHSPGNFDECTVLQTPQPAPTLPGWEAGRVSVQDAGAQLAGQLLQATISEVGRSGATDKTPATATMSLLDACAAPGGKLFHLMERCAADKNNNISFTALENNPERAQNMQTLGERLGLKVTPLVVDARQREWWNGESYTHILVDAPCSGTGTLRRHPDIKLLLQPAQIDEHARTQRQILHNLWPMLAPGGTLLYCTCSILEQENDATIEAFLHAQSNAQPNPQSDVPQEPAPASNLKSFPVKAATKETAAVNVHNLHLPFGHATTYGWQILPTDADTDGFYYAMLSKPVTNTSAETP